METRKHFQKSPILHQNLYQNTLLKSFRVYLMVILTFLSFLSINNYLLSVDAIEFYVELKPKQTKCFGENLRRDILFICNVSSESVVSLYIFTQDGQDFSVPKTLIYRDTHKHIKHAFTTDIDSGHVVCIQNNEGRLTTVAVKIYIGAEHKDFSHLAKVGHLNDTMEALYQVTDKMKLYRSNLLHLREEEEKIRKINEQNSSRMIFFTTITIISVVFFALLQAYYFRNFFKNKKLI